MTNRYHKHQSYNARLAETIEAYWRERGRRVSVYFGNGGHHSAIKSTGIPQNTIPKQHGRG